MAALAASPGWLYDKVALSAGDLLVKGDPNRQLDHRQGGNRHDGYVTLVVAIHLHQTHAMRPQGQKTIPIIIPIAPAEEVGT